MTSSNGSAQGSPETTASTVRRTVVVAAASRHGSTAEIADRVATRLRAALPGQWDVRRGDAGNTWSLADADAVVLGSPIYFGRWLRPARRALERLEEREYVWLFSSGPVSDAEAENSQLIEEDRPVMSRGVHDHAVFGGRLDLNRLSHLERWVARLVRAKAGDHRDWDAIDAWADGIADELSPQLHPDPLRADRAGHNPTGERP